MCRDTELLPATPLAVRQARHFVRDACLRWELGGVSDDVTLAVSELVTNAVLHARTLSRLRVCVSQGVVEAAVIDGAARQPLMRPERQDLVGDLDTLADLADDVGALDADPRAPALAVGASGAVTAGRGLLIVDAVADDWGTRHHLDGKLVWFTLHAPPGWRWVSTCLCATAATTSPSGRRITHQPGPWDVPHEGPGDTLEGAS